VRPGPRPRPGLSLARSPARTRCAAVELSRSFGGNCWKDEALCQSSANRVDVRFETVANISIRRNLQLRPHDLPNRAPPAKHSNGLATTVERAQRYEIRETAVLQHCQENPKVGIRKHSSFAATLRDQGRNRGEAIQAVRLEITAECMLQARRNSNRK
jgi:hypothetical protein